MVRLLLENSRIDVNKADKYGETGFMYACFYGHTEIITIFLEDSRIDVNKGNKDGETGFMFACSNGDRETASVLRESSRVDCVRGWKEIVYRLCLRLSENVMRDRYAEGSLYSVWYNLNGIGMGVFIRGWNRRSERMKEAWIYGDRGRRENQRSSEMVIRRETEWRRVSDYILEEDLTSVLILFHYAERIQRELKPSYYRDRKIRVLEMESM